MDLERTPLLTDLYQLTMLDAYLANGMQATASFELFTRELPHGRDFLLAAGLEPLLHWLEQLRFSGDELAFLEGTGRFSHRLLHYLRDFRFEGDVWAIPEGTLCFPGEPLVRVTAPLPQAQLIESRLINLVHFSTLIASKAARCMLAAPGKLLVDFGMRRAHGAEAALHAARASYLAGFAGSATVAAGLRYNIPLYGTMAHSFIQAHDRESEAFRHFARAQPGNVILLIDTYDTETAAQKVVHLAEELAPNGITVKAVRLDSGDLAAHARNVRAILDAGGLTEVAIFASGDLDEARLAALATAPVDGFGVGTRLDTSADAPYFDCAYKLVEYAGWPRRKRSERKATLPGRKQVHRRSEAGLPVADTITLEGMDGPGQALLIPVMRAGVRVDDIPTLEESREHALDQLAHLPRFPYPVHTAPELAELAERVDNELALAELEDRPTP